MRASPLQNLPARLCRLPYTARVHAENIVRRPTRCARRLPRPAGRTPPRPPISRGSRRAWSATTSSARPRWWTSPACASDRRQGGDPAQVNPVVPVQLIVDHSLAVERRASTRRRSTRTAPSKTAATPTASISSEWTKLAFENVDVIPNRQRDHAPDQPGEDVAGDPRAGWRRLPGHLRRHRQHPRTWMRLGVIAIGVGAGSRERDARPRLVMRLPDIVGSN